MREYFELGGAHESDRRRRSPRRSSQAPIVPKKFFHTAGNFREHEEESKNVDWSHQIAPWINFFQNVDAIIGPDEPIIYPEHLTEELDYELELAVVLQEGRQVVLAGGGSRLHRRLRDLQRHHRARHPARRDALGRLQLLQGDRHVLPLGPWIVTPDELGDPHDLKMELRVNGDVRQESHSGRMSVTIAEILSNFSALGYSAGDVLSTGTVSGVAGFKSEEERKLLYLKPGDVVEAEIEKIGVLRNPVISWQEGHGHAGAAAHSPLGRRVDLGARRREARPRPRADGGARPGRTRRPRARQRALPDELLGHEGLRRVRLPARGRAGADHDRGVGGGRGAQRVDGATCGS